MYDIPIVLFIFRRTSGLTGIMEKIRNVKPGKLYIIADGPRNSKEKEETDKCRNLLESLIDWDCEVVKNYAVQNRGVYRNIGEGAKWVFQKEKWAIFLEDDNLPELSFFEFCKDLLERYRSNSKILWVCGTNYLGKYESQYSYVFTQHLLPCGWASWGEKFLKFYDGLLETLDSPENMKNFEESYKSKKLYAQQLYSIKRTRHLLETNINRGSWDYQMLYSIRGNGLYGISPVFNQIKNIGVDAISEHGGNSWKKTMTERLCGMPSYLLKYPLNHPEHVSIDDKYERSIDKILLLPIVDRLKQKIARFVKPMLGLNAYDSMAEYLRERKKWKR